MLNPTSPPIQRVVMLGKRYLAPRPDGRLLVGSTEEDVGFDNRTTAAGIRDLLEQATASAPSLGDAHVERTWAGLRPGTGDRRPFIGPVPGHDGLLVAAGHYRSGILLSPITGLVIKQLIMGEPAAIALEAFSLDRVDC